MPRLAIDTPLGVLIATRSNDPGHPGISIDLDPMDGKGQLPVAYIETDDGRLVTRVWGDATQEDPTCRVDHGAIPAPLPGYAPSEPDRRRLVYICAPYKGADMREREQNVQNARMHAMYVLGKGCVPYAAHLAVCGFLDDDIPAERDAGIAVDAAVMALCDELWVFGDKISAGMKAEIAAFEKANKPIVYVDRDKA